MLGHSPDRPLALAVSGGPDSMAMLSLATAAFPGRVVAATVDHRLRAGSADEAAMVAGHCRAVGVPHTILTPRAGWSPRTVQADARQLRYTLLGDWACRADAAALLTAHHADDQAETFLMRAVRGSGVAGLGGIRARWTWESRRWHGDPAAADQSLPVIRPLLGWRRSELAEVAAATATPFVTDPSNADDRYDRVRIRALLARHPEIDSVQVAHAAAACAEADAAIDAMMSVLRRERCRATDDRTWTYDVSDLPRELRRRVARDAIGHVRGIAGITEGRWSGATNVEALLDALDAAGKATLAGVLATANGETWSFSPAPPRRAR
jgi:tRNA(Ile)-lysidine synthase